MTIARFGCRFAAAALAACWLVASAQAQTYPTRTIKMVIAFPPGGPTDFVGRLLADKLKELLGQSVIVENKAGANGAIGADAVAKSEPDGYTLFFTTVGAVAITPNLRNDMPYDTLRDFAPVSLVVNNTTVLVVSPSLAANSAKDLAAMAKLKPDTLASALWGVDAQLLYAQEDLKGFYMHSAIAKCGAPKPFYKAYTPFCAATDADATAGRLGVRPVYYSSLLVHALGAGNKFASVTNGDLTHVRAYALRNGSTLKLVLVNVSTGSRSTSVHLGGTFTSGTQFRLTGSALDSKSGMQLGGHFVGTDGTFAGVDTTPVSVSGSTLNITLPAASATVYTLNP